MTQGEARTLRPGLSPIFLPHELFPLRPRLLAGEEEAEDVMEMPSVAPRKSKSILQIIVLVVSGLAIALLVGGGVWMVIVDRRAVATRVKQNLPVYGYLRLAPDKQTAPFRYIAVDKQQIRVATTAQGLENAPPLPGRQESISYRDFDPKKNIIEEESWIYPPIKLPTIAPEVLDASVIMTLYRNNNSDTRLFDSMSWVSGEVWITQRDTKGVPWKYRCQMYGPLASTPQGGSAVITPRQIDPTGIEMRVDGHYDPQNGKLQLNAAVFYLDKPGAGNLSIKQVNGSPAPVEYVVRDAAGKVIHRGMGTIYEGTFYWITVPRPDAYTITATLAGPVYARPPIQAQCVVRPSGGPGFQGRIPGQNPRVRQAMREKAKRPSR